MKVVLCILIVFTFFTVSCKDKTDTPPKTDTSKLTPDNHVHNVYVNPASTVYHDKDCKQLSKFKMVVPQKYAIKNDFEPCMFCQS